MLGMEMSERQVWRFPSLCLRFHIKAFGGRPNSPSALAHLFPPLSQPLVRTYLCLLLRISSLTIAFQSKISKLSSNHERKIITVHPSRTSRPNSVLILIIESPKSPFLFVINARTHSAHPSLAHLLLSQNSVASFTPQPRDNVTKSSAKYYILKTLQMVTTAN